MARIKYKYGLDKWRYDFLLSAQESACAICKIKFTAKNLPHIDHSHDNGLVRGLLCRQCNLGLGFFKDNTKVMEKAIEYIEATTWS